MFIWTPWCSDVHGQEQHLEPLHMTCWDILYLYVRTYKKHYVVLSSMYRFQGSITRQNIVMMIKLPYMASWWYNYILNEDVHANRIFWIPGGIQHGWVKKLRDWILKEGIGNLWTWTTLYSNKHYILINLYFPLSGNIVVIIKCLILWVLGFGYGSGWHIGFIP